MLLGVSRDLRDLGLSDLEGEHATDSLAARVHFEHDAGGSGSVHTEDSFEHIDDEFHRGVIVIEQNDAKQRRSLEARLGLLGDQTAFMLCTLFRHQNFAKE